MSLKKSHNHDHFWIEDGFLYESCNTIRGLRYFKICEIDYPDTDCLNQVDSLVVYSQIENRKSQIQ